MKIYLAGPEVFYPDPIGEGERLKAICAKFGHEGIFPLDGGLDLSNLSKDEMALAIFQANIDKIKACDAIIANISPFRGPGMDQGTAFEIGYGYGLGKIIIGWTSNPDLYPSRVRDYFNGQLMQEDRLRDPDGLEVEDLDQAENLMITKSLDAITNGFENAAEMLQSFHS